MKNMGLSFLILACIALHTHASVIESNGVNSVETDRASLEARDYKFNLRNGLSFMDAEAGWSARILDLSKSPALGGRDVQMQVADGVMEPKGRFLRHYHPRSTELVYQVRGKSEFRIEFENGSIATNVLRKGDILVIPQGLIHDARCLSTTKRCRFTATFRTADPGLVGLPFRD